MFPFLGAKLYRSRKASSISDRIPVKHFYKVKWEQNKNNYINPDFPKPTWIHPAELEKRLRKETEAVRWRSTTKVDQSLVCRDEEVVMRETETTRVS
jgi:hypothetical protein